MKILAIANQKGGVGKTTTAVNLAACLAQNDHKTLLIDLDAQANATNHLGIDPSSNNKTTYELLADKNFPIDKSIISINSNFSIIPAPASHVLSEIDLVLMSALQRETRLSNALKKLNSKFEFLIIDTPPHLGMATLNAFMAATNIIITVQTNYFGAEALTRLLAVLQEVSTSGNPTLEVCALATMHRPNVNANREILTNLQERFPHDLLKTVIRFTTILHEASMSRQPICDYAKGSHGHRDYQQLTEEIINHVS